MKRVERAIHTYSISFFGSFFLCSGRLAPTIKISFSQRPEPRGQGGAGQNELNSKAPSFSFQPASLSFGRASAHSTSFPSHLLPAERLFSTDLA